MSLLKLIMLDMLPLIPPLTCYLILLCKLFFTLVMHVHFNKRYPQWFNCDICSAFALNSLYS